MAQLKRIVVALGVAFLLFGFVRLAWVAVSNTPPARFTTYMTNDCPYEPPSWPTCSGDPRFVDGDHVWAFCISSLDLYPWKTGMVRFDLANRRADMLWPFPDHEAHELHGFTKHPSGDIAVAIRSGDVYRLGADGGVTNLELPGPRTVGGSIVAIAWVGDGLEVVTGGRARPSVHRLPAGGGWSSAPLEQLECSEGQLCMLQAAARESTGWRLWYVHWPSRIAAGELSEAEIVEVAPSRRVRRVARFALDPERDYYQDTDGSLRSRLRQFLDRSMGNVVFLDHRDELDEPWELDADGWSPRTLPDSWPPEPGWYRHREDYIVHSERLEPVPAWGDVHRSLHRVRDRWIQSSSRNRELTLRTADGQPGPVLVNDPWISSRMLIAPASEGGYWLLGPYGTHLRVDTDLARADVPGFFDRFFLLYNNFHHLAWYNDFWLNASWLKMCVLPLLLLFPFIVSVLLAVLCFTRRKSLNEELVKTLFPYAIAYVLAWCCFGWWFWKLTGYF